MESDRRLSSGSSCCGSTGTDVGFACGAGILFDATFFTPVNLLTPEGITIGPLIFVSLPLPIVFTLIPGSAGATFLDLYSGSGAIGIEALSRGAKK